MNATAANDGSATEQAQRSTIFVHGAGRPRTTVRVFFDREESESFGAEATELSVVGEIHEGFMARSSMDFGFDLYAFMEFMGLVEIAVILQEGARNIGVELKIALDLSNGHSAEASIISGDAELWSRIEELTGEGSQITFLIREEKLFKPDYEILRETLEDALAVVRLQSSKPLYIADRSKSGWSPFLLDQSDVAEALSSAFPIHALRFIGELPHEALVHEHTLLAASGVIRLLNLAQSLGVPLQALFDLQDGSNPGLELVGGQIDFLIALEDRVLNYSLEPVVGWDYRELVDLLDLIRAHQELGYGTLSYGSLLVLTPAHWSAQS